MVASRNISLVKWSTQFIWKAVHYSLLNGQILPTAPYMCLSWFLWNVGCLFSYQVNQMKSSKLTKFCVPLDKTGQASCYRVSRKHSLHKPLSVSWNLGSRATNKKTIFQRLKGLGKQSGRCFSCLILLKIVLCRSKYRWKRCKLLKHQLFYSLELLNIMFK